MLRAVERACEVAGLDRVNAYKSAVADDGGELDIDTAARFAGLHYLGVFDGVVK